MKQVFVCSVAALIAVGSFTSCASKKETMTTTSTTAATKKSPSATTTTQKKKSDTGVTPSPSPAG